MFSSYKSTLYTYDKCKNGGKTGWKTKQKVLRLD